MIRYIDKKFMLEVFLSRIFKGVFISILLALLACSSLDKPIIEVDLEPDDPKFAAYIGGLRQQYKDDPSNFSLLLKIKRLENSAVNYFYMSGLRQMAKGDSQSARQQFELGLGLVENHPKLEAEIKYVDAYEQSTQYYVDAKNQYKLGKYKKSLELVEQALKVNPDNSDYQRFRNRVSSDYIRAKRDRHKIDLKFIETDFKDVARFVCDTFGVNVVFDASVKDHDITLDMPDVPFVKAIDLLSKISKNRFKVVDSSTLFIYSDTKQKQKEFEELYVRSFVLETMDAKEMASILKSVLGVKNITINESISALIVKAPFEELIQVEKIIEQNDISPGEVVLNVEILEVNLSDAQRFGLNFGSYQISTSTPAIPIGSSIRSSYKEVTTLNIPSISLDAFKQAVSAKSLARPSIRVIDGEKAKIHIGDRVPLRKSSILDATGQTRTTFEYQEIGIKFNVEANIHSADSITVKLNLEVSSLGENLGTPTEQAFRIGTRNADTTMLIENGETVILGGLIRDEDRSTYSNIYGLEKVPVINKLTGSKDESVAQTDLLLTVTPQIVRNIKKKTRQPSFDEEYGMSRDIELSKLDALVLKAPRANVVPLGTEKTNPFKVVLNSQDDTHAEPAQNRKSFEPKDKKIIPELLLSFSEPSYNVVADSAQDLLLQMRPSNLNAITIQLNVNANIINLADLNVVDPNWIMDAAPDIKRGIAKINLTKTNSQNNVTSDAPQNLLSIRVTPKRKGTSFAVAKLESADEQEALNITPAKTSIRVE